MQKLNKFYLEIESLTSTNIQNLAQVSHLLLNHHDTAVRSSICFFIAEYKIKELQGDVIRLLCLPISVGNDSTLIYASRQFECSQYFEIYIALIIDRSYSSCQECNLALRKCRKISIKSLIYAKEALECWSYFHDIDIFNDSETISKRNLIYEVWLYLKYRIKKAQKQSRLEIEKD